MARDAAKGDRMKRVSVSAFLCCVISAPLHAGTFQAAFTDVEYANVNGHSLKLDIYLPSTGTPPWPCVVWVHGGGWRSGDKDLAFEDAQELTARGMAVISPEYRFTDVALWPAQIYDVKAAVRWMRAHAATYNVDPARFGAMGFSSGGHLVTMLGLAGDVSSLEGTVGGNLAYSSAVSAVVDQAGHTDFMTITGQSLDAGSASSALLGHWLGDTQANANNPSYAGLVAFARNASPITYLTTDDPPFYIFHGAFDGTVPVSQSEELRNALLAAGIPVTYFLDPLAGHFIPPQDNQAMYAFLAQRLLFTVAAEPTPDFDWHTVDGGGGSSSGGSFRMTGTIAQSDAGVMKSGQFFLSGGFWPSSPACFGDMNGDGQVNSADLALLLGSWGPNPSSGADLSGDGQVNSADLALLLGSWGPCH